MATVASSSFIRRAISSDDMRSRSAADAKNLFGGELTKVGLRDFGSGSSRAPFG